MNTAAIFFLILGQANGVGQAAPPAYTSMVVVPAPYRGATTEDALAACQTAGEAARGFNVGLSYLSYTCVPTSALSVPCDEICELIEAKP